MNKDINVFESFGICLKYDKNYCNYFRFLKFLDLKKIYKYV